MKAFACFFFLFLLVACTEEKEHFTIEVLNGYTPVKNQGKSQTCWAYGMLAAIETEHIMRGDSVNLSVVWVEHMMEKDASAPASKRGMGMTLVNLIQRYGLVPYDAMSRKGDIPPRFAFMLGATAFGNSPGNVSLIIRGIAILGVILDVTVNWIVNSGIFGAVGFASILFFGLGVLAGIKIPARRKSLAEQRKDAQCHKHRSSPASLRIPPIFLHTLFLSCFVGIPVGCPVGSLLRLLFGIKTLYNPDTCNILMNECVQI